MLPLLAWNDRKQGQTHYGSLFVQTGIVLIELSSLQLFVMPPPTLQLLWMSGEKPLCWSLVLEIAVHLKTKQKKKEQWRKELEHYINYNSSCNYPFLKLIMVWSKDFPSST